MIKELLAAVSKALRPRRRKRSSALAVVHVCNCGCEILANGETDLKVHRSQFVRCSALSWEDWKIDFERELYDRTKWLEPADWEDIVKEWASGTSPRLAVDNYLSSIE